jgi:hypothetical protein
MRRSAFAVFLVAIAVVIGRPAWAQAVFPQNNSAASALTGLEQFPCIQSASTKICTITQAVTFTYSLLSGDLSCTSGGACTVTKTNGAAFGSLATAGTPLSVANGGNGTASPGITAGTGIAVGGSWPAQSVSITTPVSIANGGNGTASPGITAGTGITVGGSWPTQSVALTTPVSVANGGNGTATPAITAGSGITVGGSWPAQSVALTTPVSVANGGTGTSTPSLIGGTNVTITGTWPNQTVTASGGSGSAQGDYSTGKIYLPYGVIPSISAGATNANVIKCIQGRVLQKLTIPALGFNFTTLSAGGNAQAAIYKSVAGVPDAKIDSTASISTAATGYVTGNLGVSRQVGPGGTDGDQVLWWCSNFDNSVAVATPGAIVPGLQDGIIGSATAANLFSAASNVSGISCSAAACNGGSSTFGTWPATLAGSTWTDVVARTTAIPGFQPSSIP